jgi:hypothetical protein
MKEGGNITRREGIAAAPPKRCRPCPDAMLACAVLDHSTVALLWKAQMVLCVECIITPAPNNLTH